MTHNRPERRHAVTSDSVKSVAEYPSPVQVFNGNTGAAERAIRQNADMIAARFTDKLFSR